MKKFLIFLGMVVVLNTATSLQAQSLTQDQFDFIAAQAESMFPELFPTGPETFSAQELGSTWFARFYAATGIYLALNVNESALYTLGGPWPEPTLHGSLVDILNQLGYVAPGSGGGGDGGSGGDGGGGGGTGGGQEGNAILTQGGGNCVNLVDPTVGTIATYAVSQFADGVNAEINFTTTYTAVTANSVTTEIDQNSVFNGIASNSLSVNTSFHEKVNGWLFTTASESEVTATVQGQTLVSTTSLMFDPAEFESPLEICDGMSWFSAGVTLTSTGMSAGFPLPPTTSQTGEEIVEVISVNEQVTVPAGTFSTVHQINRSLDTDGMEDGYSEAWFINELGGVAAKVDFYERENGMEVLISTSELQSVNN